VTRKLSIPRLLVLIGVLLGVAAAVGVAARQMMASPTEAPQRARWFAPYVDATSTPEFQFQDPAANPSNGVVLGFVVATKRGACVPTWGTYFSLDAARGSLDLERRIARLRQHGGDLIVSFGGAANDELALRCTEPALEAAYRQVIDRYSLDTVDFDLEGAALRPARR
jgi:chitinase